MAAVGALMAIRQCQNCGKVRNTQHCLFKANMSFFFTRWYREIDGHLCLRCTTTKFFAFEVSTLCLTWFGIIGMFLGPVYLLHNIVEYIEALYKFFRERKPSPMSTDSRLILALAIVFATLFAAWMFLYESYGLYNASHRNRFTGATCHASEECWFSNGRDYQ
jgi:hypothetical protein